MMFSSFHSSDRCRELANPDITNFSVSIFIVLGILISYLPQHHKIISRRSSAGLSPLFVLLGTISGTASIANILTLPESTRDMRCCSEISRFACSAALLGIVQIGVQWTCFFFILMLFLIFFPQHPSPTAEDPTHTDPDLPTWREAILVLSLSLAFFLIAFVGSVIFVYAAPSHIRGWANFLGLLGTTLAGIQYVPQIVTTYRLGRVGSLSVPMMCIQTPGSFVFAASLAVRLGPAGWSAWGLFIFTGCLQGCLLVMSLRFLWEERKERKKAEARIGNGNGIGSLQGNGRVGEETPLLGGS